jgi:hypothetical protein
MTSSNDDLIAERPGHPDELLAGLADGTLDERERAEVDAHLATCASCREELPLALRGATAASRLPEVDPPVGMTRSVVDEARPVRSPRARKAWAWAAAPVAAAVVALAVWALVGSGGGGGLGGVASPGVGGGGAAAAPEQVTDSRIRVSPENFDQAKIQDLAGKLASRRERSDVLSSEGSSEAKRTASAAQGAFANPASDPIRCIKATADPTKDDQFLEVLVARFDGTPAFVGVFVHRPGAGQPPSLLTIWVASQSGCRLLHYASQPLNR